MRTNVRVRRRAADFGWYCGCYRDHAHPCGQKYVRFSVQDRGGGVWPYLINDGLYILRPNVGL